MPSQAIEATNRSNEMSIASSRRRWLGDDGMNHMVMIHPCLEVDLPSAQEIINAFPRLGSGQKAPNLVDITGLKTAITRAARAYDASEEADSILTATAPQMNSAMAQLIGHGYRRRDKPKPPTRLLTNESDALNEITEYRQTSRL